MAKRIVLLRHGQSTWNLENRFTGWTDVTLTEQGIGEAKKAGQLLKAEGFHFGVAHTSLLSRAIKTLWLALEEMDRMYIPIHHTWRLNEKHYGMLQGLNKAETAAQYGDEQVKIWRRSYDIAPPELPDTDPRSNKHEARYATIGEENIPRTESLKDTIARAVPYWNEQILPSLDQHDDVLVVAHGNSLRGIIKVLKNMSEAEILELNLPTAVPYVFEFDENKNPVKDYFLGDPEEIKALMDAVANQAAKK